MPCGARHALAILLIWVGLAVANMPPLAKQGELDLRHFDFSTQPTITLQGEWSFTWQQLAPPDSAFPPPLSRQRSGYPAYSPVPLRWNQLYDHHQRTLPAFGHATYRLRIRLPHNHPPLGLLLESPYSSAKLWVNGLLAGQSGNPTPYAASYAPQFQNLYYEIPGDLNTLEINLQVANYSLHRGGFLRPMELGDATVLHKQMVIQRAARYLLSGGLLLMVLYHLILYLSRRNDRMQIYFTGIAFTAILRILIPGDHLIQNLLPFLSFEMIIRIEYISLLAIISFIALFLREFFPNRIPDKLCQSLWGAALGFGVFTLIAPLHQVTSAQIITQMVNIAGGILLLIFTSIALYKRDRGAGLVLTTLVLLYLAVINDILHARQVIHTFYASSYAIFILVFVQWALIAQRYSQTLHMLHEQREQFLRSMAIAIESKDAYTGGHVERVACFSRDLAQVLGWNEHDAYELYLAAMVHDVGKIGVRDSILNKPDRLDDNEMLAMQKHPGIGYHMLSSITESDFAAQITLHHHQRWNGKGYTGLDEFPPLQGDQIPIASRIVAVADFWDAISSDRPYRKAMPLEKSLSVLISEHGVGLDPELVRLFLTKGIWLRYLQNQPSSELSLQAWNIIRTRWPENAPEQGAFACPA